MNKLLVENFKCGNKQRKKNFSFKNQFSRKSKFKNSFNFDFLNTRI